MFDRVNEKIEAALRPLKQRGLALEARLDAFCRVLGRELLALEISPTTALACLRAIRTRIELTQTLRRPHPVATVRAIVMEILEDVPETAFLFSRAVTLPREWRRPAAAVQRARRSDAPKPWGPATERRVTQPLSFRHFRNFEPGEGHRSVDAYRRLDRETFRRHLKQVRRRPEPPTPDLWGANHV